MVQEIHFVTGKGGVGKSLFAAALANKYSQAGRKTLLVELGDQSYFANLFGIENVRYVPTNLKGNLDIAIWNGTESLREYARFLLKIETLYKLFFENPVSRSLVNVAPALPELAILGKITSDPRKHGPPMDYEVLVIDAFATGHFLSLLRAPRGMAEAVSFGPMGEQSRSIDRTLFQQGLCHFHVVTLAEELPIQETIELCETLNSEFAIKPKVILNKVIKTFLKAKDLESSTKNQTSADFTFFLQQQLLRIESALAKLTEQGIEPKRLSFVPETRIWPLLEAIQAELS